MTAIQLNVFDAPPPAAPVKAKARATRRRDLPGTHSASAELKAAFLRGEELTPMDAVRLFGMQANSFHRAMFHIKRDTGIDIVKTEHVANGKRFYSYKIDRANSLVGRAA